MLRHYCPSCAAPWCARLMRAAHGATLIELLVVVAILAVVAAVALPSYQHYLERARVRQAAEDILGLIVQARAEAPVRDRNVYLSIDSDVWCLGFSTIPRCDCSQPTGEDACTLPVAGELVRQVISGADHPTVGISSNFPGNGTGFNRLRGNASPGGSIRVVSGTTVAEVRVGVSGRVRLCALPGSGLRGYPLC